MAKGKTTRRKKQPRKKRTGGAAAPSKRLRLDGTSLQLGRLAPLVRGGELHLTVSAGARIRVKAARAFVDQTRPREDRLDGGVGSGGGAGFGGSDSAGDAGALDVDHVEGTQMPVGAVQDTEDDEALAPARTPAHTEGE